MKSRFFSYYSLLLIIGISLAATATFHRLSQVPDSQRFIVQANSLEQAASLVRDAGAEVSHELAIINSVGARLTPAQLEELRGMKEVRRVYADHGVNTTTVTSLPPSDTSAACTLSADRDLVFDGDDVEWTVTNTSDIALNIAKIMVIWPAANDELEEIEFDNREIYVGRIFGISAAFNALMTNVDDPKLRLAPGESKVFEVEFDEDAVPDPASYEIRLMFYEGCSIDFPLPAVAKFEGDSDLDAKRTYISSLVGADALHWEDVTGDGVGVAVVDTGTWGEMGKSKYLVESGWGTERVTGHYDAIKDQELKIKSNSDHNGHGSHVTSLLLSSRHKDSEYNGIAPDANLVAVRAFNDDGAGTYADVIRGLDWIFNNKDALGIRVVNLSFSTEPQSYYWDDPLNQAVMALWRSGLVVVASAGNTGPGAMTIGVPGNVPYVITVGATTDNVTPMDWSDDALASFSSAGPTVEAFVKPEIVAPGGHVRGMMEPSNTLAKSYPHFMTAIATTRCRAPLSPQPSSVAQRRCCCRRSRG